MSTRHTDRTARLIPLIQEHFPIRRRPFRAIAEKAGLTEGETIDAMRSMLESGLVRTVGPVFEARRLGYTSTLAAAKADTDAVDDLARRMREIGEITHNYLREHEVNLWFTVTARTNGRRDAILGEIGNHPGVSRLFDLPVITLYKIRAVFGGGNSGRHSTPAGQTSPITLGGREKQAVRILQEGLPAAERPFEILADRAGMSEDDLLALVEGWLDNGVIRRFGARLNHRRAGFGHNTLAAWRGGDIDALGAVFAERGDVSHCYRRKSHPEWPWDLYTMVHARSEEELDDAIAGMKDRAAGSSCILLPTKRELKKTVMRYFMEA